MELETIIRSGEVLDTVVDDKPSPARRLGLNVAILGTSHALPKKIIGNDTFTASGAVTDEWIMARTGIRERRQAGPDEHASILGTQAAHGAMQQAGIGVADLDVIICTTVTPEMLLPSTACQIQAHLGAKKAAAFDLVAACSGFLYGAWVARGLLAASTKPQHILVANVDYITRIVTQSNVKTSVLFGDGAAAAIFSNVPHGPQLIDVEVASDGAAAELLYIPAGGSGQPFTNELLESGQTSVQMNGPALFRLAVERMTESALAILHKHGYTIDDVDVFVPHQANLRIIEAVGQRLRIAPEKVVINVDTIGNTASASIPIALDQAARSGKIKPGNLVLMAAFGGGLTWGAALVEWG
jgi:3-oxoacyl-[acyl-carrier-protein] synthase III